MEALFKDDFGTGYPAKDAERKQKDAALLKEIKKNATISMDELLQKLPVELVDKVRDYME